MQLVRYPSSLLLPSPRIVCLTVKYSVLELIAYVDKHFLNLLQKALLSKLFFTVWREGLMTMTFSNYWTTFRLIEVSNTSQMYDSLRYLKLSYTYDISFC